MSVFKTRVFAHLSYPLRRAFCDPRFKARLSLVRSYWKGTGLRLFLPQLGQKGLEVCYFFWGVPCRPSPGSYPGPVQVPSRVRGGPVQIRHVLCFTVFQTHPGPEVGAIPARPGPILLPSVPYRIGPGRAETDFLATSEQGYCEVIFAARHRFTSTGPLGGYSWRVLKK